MVQFGSMPLAYHIQKRNTDHASEAWLTNLDIWLEQQHYFKWNFSLHWTVNTTMVPQCPWDTSWRKNVSAIKLWPNGSTTFTESKQIQSPTPIMQPCSLLCFHRLWKALDRMWFSHEFSGVIFFFLQLVSEGRCGLTSRHSTQLKLNKKVWKVWKGLKHKNIYTSSSYPHFWKKKQYIVLLCIYCLCHVM